MAVYAVGDVQGCLDALRALLERIDFQPSRDRLWLVGDLVNRGPHSLETLRFVRELGERAVAVLGNHDLHLLAVAAGAARVRRRDTLSPVLGAPDRDVLLEWLRQRPLLHHDPDLAFTMVHAGLAPDWDLDTAARCAREVEAVLRGPGHRELLAHMYGDEPARWSNQLAGWARLRFIINALTRLRYCDEAGGLALGASGPPGSQSPGLVPWFEIPWRRSRERRIVFGHWATLQLARPLDPGLHGVYHVDTGCVWGGHLTALRLDDRRFFHVHCDKGAAAARR